MNFKCPICQYDKLDNDPKKPTYEICPQCGVEFGFEAPMLFPKIRKAWQAAGKPFWRHDRQWQKTLENIQLDF